MNAAPLVSIIFLATFRARRLSDEDPAFLKTLPIKKEIPAMGAAFWSEDFYCCFML